MSVENILRQKEGFREELLTWFESEKELHPWRLTKDPWAILVSEVMLQQTQIATVLNKGFYVNFLNKFPDVETISTASEQEILKAWEGLGYYRRVRNLQKTAQAVVREHAGIFPRDYHSIIALPGVGPYTAGAVSSFAFDLPVELVDANVARVFSRLFDYHEYIDSSAGSKQLYVWAKQLLDEKNPAAYNSALMELGQKICRNKNPQCMLCPVRAHCATKTPELLPKKKPRRATVEVQENCAWVVAGDKILLEQQSQGIRREGMWALPLILDEKSLEDQAVLHQSSYGITHHKVDLRVYARESIPENEFQKWFELSQLGEIPMPSPFRRVLDSLVK